MRESIFAGKFMQPLSQNAIAAMYSTGEIIMETIYGLMDLVPIVLEKIHGINARTIFYMEIIYGLIGLVPIVLGVVWGINNRMTRVVGVIYGLIGLVLSVLGKFESICAFQISLLGAILGLIGLVSIVLGLLMLLLFLVYMVIAILLSSIPILTLFSGHFRFMSEHIWDRGLDLLTSGKSWKLVGHGFVLQFANMFVIWLADKLHPTLYPVILGLLLVVAGRIMFRKIPRYR